MSVHVVIGLAWLFIGAGICQGPHDTILGADTICTVILVTLTILYVLLFDTVILLRFDVPNISLTIYICLLQRDKREPREN